MLELPETLARAKELNMHIRGKIVERVCPPSSPHKFFWHNGEIEKYEENLKGKRVENTAWFGIYVEIEFEGKSKLNFNDGVNVRLLTPGSNPPVKYQLLIEFTDGFLLVFTVAMYGGIIYHDDNYDNEYYIKSKEVLSPLSDDFNESYFTDIISLASPKMSVKEFLATKQRIPGLGNGVLQDILFHAGVHPKRKLVNLEPTEKIKLYQSIKSVLKAMSDGGGRDTEKDIFGNPGNYKTAMSKNTYKGGCPACQGEIVKQAYLGGTVYYCPNCQPSE